MATTLDPAKLNNATLSGGNLTITATGVNGQSLSTTSHSSGKYHLEFTVVTATNQNLAIGFVTPSHNITIDVGDTGDSSRSYGLWGGARSSLIAYLNGVNQGTGVDGWTTGDTVAIEVDIDNLRFWYRNITSGVNRWNDNATANPATNTLGISISAVAGGPSFFFAANPYASTLGMTVNFGATAFALTPSSGFTAWDPSGGVTQNLAGNLTPTVAFAGNASLTEALAGNLAPSVSLAANAGAIRGVAGGLAPTVAFAGNVSLTEALSGNLAPTVVLSSTLSTGRLPIDLSGNLGGQNLYGKLAYGLKAYSSSVLQPSFSASAGTVFGLSGGLAPVVSFSASMSGSISIGGNLAPIVSFSGTFGTLQSLVGNIAPRVTFSGTVDVPQTSNLQGNLTPIISFAASGLLSGPLWAASEPCPPPMWVEVESCSDPGWIPLVGPNDTVYQASVYGVGGYGANLYGKGEYVSAEPSPWESAELCHG